MVGRPLAALVSRCVLRAVRRDARGRARARGRGRRRRRWGEQLPGRGVPVRSRAGTRWRLVNRRRHARRAGVGRGDPARGRPRARRGHHRRRNAVAGPRLRRRRGRVGDARRATGDRRQPGGGATGRRAGGRRRRRDGDLHARARTPGPPRPASARMARRASRCPTDGSWWRVAGRGAAAARRSGPPCRCSRHRRASGPSSRRFAAAAPTSRFASSETGG